MTRPGEGGPWQSEVALRSPRQIAELVLSPKATRLGESPVEGSPAAPRNDNLGPFSETPH